MFEMLQISRFLHIQLNIHYRPGLCGGFFSGVLGHPICIIFLKLRPPAIRLIVQYDISARLPDVGS